MSFRFHYFSKKPFSARNLLSTMKAQSDNFESINLNTIRSMKLTNNIESNKKIKQLILSKNLEKDFSQNTENNKKILKEILPMMLSFNNHLPDDIKIENDKKNDTDIECSNIISCFQLLIKYLYEKEIENKKFNEELEKRITEIKKEPELNKYDNTIKRNNSKINQLQQQKIKMEFFLKKYGINPPSSSPHIYFCDQCPITKNKFFSYKSFHKHYVQNHINPYTFYNYNNDSINFNAYNNNNFDKEIEDEYFDTKINDMLKRVLNNIKRPKSQDIKLKSIKTKNKKDEIERKKYEELKERIKRFENSQKEFEITFQNKLDNFLIEFKNEIKKLSDINN